MAPITCCAFLVVCLAAAAAVAAAAGLSRVGRQHERPEISHRRYLSVVPNNDDLRYNVLALSGPVAAVLSPRGAKNAAVEFLPEQFNYFFAESSFSEQNWDDLVAALPADELQIVWQQQEQADDKIARALFQAKGALQSAAVYELFDAIRTVEVITLAKKPIRHISRANQKLLDNIAETKLGVRRDNIDDLLSLVSSSSLQGYARYLTGEDTTSPLLTRQSYSTGAVLAGDYVQTSFERAGFSTHRHSFDAAYCTNVIGEIPGAIEPSKIVILGAHLDDRANSAQDPDARAPGANDDGSGTSMVLEAARVFAAYGATFRYTLRLVTFCGEEQGLVGSRAYAADVAAADEDIVAMLQGDMIAYQTNSWPELSFVNRYTDETLTGIVTNITATYVPNLTLSTTTACCSDHQAFFENGYASAGFVEAGGYTIDPEYHRVGDLTERDGYSFEQLMLITQGIVAATAIIAELQ